MVTTLLSLSLSHVFQCWNDYVVCGNIQVIPHFYAEDVPLSQLCKLHGWAIRETPRRVFDAVIFSNEVDILEIRMQVGNKFFDDISRAFCIRVRNQRKLKIEHSQWPIQKYVTPFWPETFMILTQESCQPGLGNQISKSRPIINTIYDHQLHEGFEPPLNQYRQSISVCFSSRFIWTIW